MEVAPPSSKILLGLITTALVIFSSIPSISHALITDSGFTVSTNLTNVATMANETIHGPKDILAFKLLPARSQVVVAGTGYISLIDLTKSPPDVVWAWDIVGRATSLVTDNSKTPEWIVVGTDSGEVLAVNAKNPDFRVSYFTSSRAPVSRIGIGSVGGKTSLFVLDSEGYLYIYKLPEPGWMEIGPRSLDAPYGSIPGYTIGNASMMMVYHNDSSWSIVSERLAATVKHVDNSNLVSATAYAYLRFSNGTAIPATPIPITLNNKTNTTIQAKLYYGTIYYPYNIIMDLKTAKNATINVTGLLPSKQALAIFYIVEIRDAKTDELLNSTCYAGISGYFEPNPGENYIIGKIYATQLGSTLDDCLSSLNLKFNNNIDFSPVLAVRPRSLPTEHPVLKSTGDAWIIPYPYPVYLSPLETSSQWLYFSFDNQPVGWPAKATGMVLAGVDRYLYIYLVDSNLYPQPIKTANVFVEAVDLGSNPTSIAVTPDGSSIFVGNSMGRVLWLKWNPSMQKYVSWAALQIGPYPITSISYLKEGYILATASNGIIQLAKITDNELVPMWRGPYGYSGIETGIQGITAQGISTSLIVATGMTRHHASFYLLKVPNPDIVRVLIQVVIEQVGAGGKTQVTIPTGTVIEVYSSATKKLIATIQSTNSTFKVFIPSGKYIFRIYVPGLGYITKTATVNFPEYKDTIKLMFRRVTVTVYIPQPGKNETYPENVKPGPVEGAMVKAIPLKISPEIGYNMTALNVSSITGKDGVAVLDLWEGVSYKLIVKAPGLTNYTTTIPSFGPVSLSVPLKPQVQKKKPEKVVKYYTLSMIVVNDEAKPLSRALVQIYDKKGVLVFSGMTGPDGKVTARLLEGSYTVKANANGYLSSELPVSIPGASQVSLTLQPTTSTKVKRMLPYILILIGIIAIVGVFYAVRARIAKWISREEEYF